MQMRTVLKMVIHSILHANMLRFMVKTEVEKKSDAPRLPNGIIPDSLRSSNLVTIGLNCERIPFAGEASLSGCCKCS